jgi:hypothetical protein
MGACSWAPAIEVNYDFLDAKLEVLGDRLTELIRDVETRLLTSFHGYGKGQSARMHLLEVSDSTTAQRLAALEERVLNLETYRGEIAFITTNACYITNLVRWK